jgi:hypothetical protein
VLFLNPCSSQYASKRANSLEDSKTVTLGMSFIFAQKCALVRQCGDATGEVPTKQDVGEVRRVFAGACGVNGASQPRAAQQKCEAGNTIHRQWQAKQARAVPHD